MGHIETRELRPAEAARIASALVLLRVRVGRSTRIVDIAGRRCAWWLRRPPQVWRSFKG